MKIKEFVKAILNDVSEAVEEANNDKHGFYLIDANREGIDFDLAIVLRKDEGGEVEGKAEAEMAMVAGVGVAGKLQQSTSEEIVNRIKFKVLYAKKS